MLSSAVPPGPAGSQTAALAELARGSGLTPRNPAPVHISCTRLNPDTYSASGSHKGFSIAPICAALESLLINLLPFSDSSVASSRNCLQLFVPIFYKYLRDGISRQTMADDANPRLQQRSLNALEIWPAADGHLLLSSAAPRHQC